MTNLINTCESCDRPCESLPNDHREHSMFTSVNWETVDFVSDCCGMPVVEEFTEDE